MFAASRAAQQRQVQVAIESERRANEAAHFAVQESIRTRNRAAVAALFADWHIGELDPRIPPSLGLGDAVLRVFNTAVTRQHVAKRHPGDVSFIMQQLVHAIAHPYMYRRSTQREDRIELVGWTADSERTLRIILEAPTADPPATGSHGWLQVNATRLGKAKRRQAEKKGGWIRWV